VSRGPSWRRPIRTIAAALFLVLLAAGPTQAAYQATVDSNESAFQPPCVGFTDALPAKMLKAATAAYKKLGYATAPYTTTSFTRAHTLARTDTDWAYYVHSRSGLCSPVARSSTRGTDLPTMAWPVVRMAGRLGIKLVDTSSPSSSTMTSWRAHRPWT
jgi:hypothetical protein